MQTRRGFSLIELLTVVAIIAVLASLSIVVMQGTVTQARENTTAMTITKVSELLEERVTAFDRAANGAVLSTEGAALDLEAQAFFGVSIRPPGKLLNTRVAEIIARKRLFRNLFPQRFGEMDDSTDVTGAPATPNGIPDLIDRLQSMLPVAERFETRVANHDPATESAEVLYLLLTELPVFGVAPAGLDAFSEGEVADTDNDGLLEFVDSWGNPLRFYRWPTRLFDPDALDTDAATPGVQSVVTDQERELANLLVRGLPQTNGITRDPLLVDPDDTIGRIGFEILRIPALASAYNEGAFHTVDVFHTPLVMSAGADGVLGLLEPNFVDADDNGDGSVDVGLEAGSGTGVFFYTEDGNGNGSHDDIFGNLASVPDSNGNGLIETVDITSDLVDSLSDNITNRNRRAGGSN